MSFVIQCNKFRKRTSAMYKNRYAHRCLSFSIHLIENRPNIFKRFDVRLLLIYTIYFKKITKQIKPIGHPGTL